MIVGGGVVLAASYEAKAHGVRTAMGGRQAPRLCPRAVVVPPRMTAYSEASKAVFAIFRETSPAVEGISIDEAFLDVRGLEHISGTPREIAAALRRTCSTRSGCRSPSASRGRSSSPRSRARSPSPTGCSSSPPGGELDFLHPLPIERLWGVGVVTAEKLRAEGMTRSASWPPSARPHSSTVLGPRCGAPPPRARPQPRPATRAAGRRRSSMGAQRALGRRAVSPAELDTALVGLVDRLDAPPARRRRVCRTVDAAAALRRLHARDALAHAARGDGEHRRDPRHGAHAPGAPRCR